MKNRTQYFFISGTSGKLECVLDLPKNAPLGIVLIAHPHPLYGGAMDNKVVQTLARTFAGLGYASVRMNFRGVGKSEGSHDNGYGEADDMALLLEHMKNKYPNLPVVLAGYSFGTYVLMLLQKRLATKNEIVERMVLVAATAGKWAVDSISVNSILIHGEHDELIPLNDVLNWVRPQDIPVIVIPGGDHFFNHKLHHLKNIIHALYSRS